MVEHLELADHDVPFIAELIDYLIMKLLPWWNPSSDRCVCGEMNPNIDGQSFMGWPWGSSLPSVPSDLANEEDDFSRIDTPPKEDFVEAEKIENGDKATFEGDYNSQRSEASEVVVENAPRKDENCDNSNVDASSKCLSSRSMSELELEDTYFEDCKLQPGDYCAGEEVVINDYPKNSGSVLGTSTNVGSSRSSCSYVSSSAEEEIDPELQFELAVIESHYQHWIDELNKMKLEALESTRRRWMAKKKLAVG